jgi:hypothetical protein
MLREDKYKVQYSQIQLGGIHNTACFAVMWIRAQLSVITPQGAVMGVTPKRIGGRGRCDG